MTTLLPPDADVPYAATLDAAIESALLDQRVVGTVLMVTEAGHLRYACAAGFADRESGRAMSLDTPFRLASVSKPFTIAAALRLMQSGKLDPQRPVTDWLPAFRPRWPDGSTPVITPDDLMSHAAGLDYRFAQPADGPYARAGISDGLDLTRDDAGRLLTLEENLRRLAGVPLTRLPRARWRYSVSIDVLGAIVAAAHGSSLPEAMEALVLAPLGLAGAAGYHSVDPRLATPYVPTPGEPPRPMRGPMRVPLPGWDGQGVDFDPDRIHHADAFTAGGASMVASAPAVLRLLDALRDGPFLDAAWRERARAQRIGPQAEVQGPGWGFAWLGSLLVDPAAGDAPLSAGSIDWGGVYGHSWHLDFARQRSVVVLTNTVIEGMNGRFARDVIEAFRPRR